MVRSRIFATAMAAVIGLAGTAGIAHAANDRVGKEAEDGKEITALLNAKTSIAQAIAAAEQETGGKAFEAELESEEGTLEFEVNVAKDSRKRNTFLGFTGRRSS